MLVASLLLLSGSASAGEDPAQCNLFTKSLSCQLAFYAILARSPANENDMRDEVDCQVIDFLIYYYLSVALTHTIYHIGHISHPKASLKC